MFLPIILPIRRRIKNTKKEKKKKNDRETQATIEILEIPTFFSRFMDRSSQLYY